jgi:transposase
MSVYVGIDVHRKRSQVAVVTQDGTVELNKNVVNGSEPMLWLIGGLPAGTPVAFEAAFGWGWLARRPDRHACLITESGARFTKS